ncbi:MAG: YegS/Rv2252/BmrU family lipid kinase [Bacteroidia bacterium]|jgi:diacylglycerol kinase (ATP)|nr:YegS/Rv2252/BmrU family lipid kinase [Bacteroidia bacterium]
MNPQQHIAIFCNPKAGKGKAIQILPLFENWLTERSIEYTVFSNKLPISLIGFTDMVVMGGDGSIQFLLNHFREIKIPIGFIRCGTGNDLTNLLFGKASYKSQFETATNGPIQAIDAGICNDRYFVNGVGIGFDGWVVKNLIEKKWLTGKAAYYATVLRLLLFHKESNMRVTTNQSSIDLNTFMIAAANGKTYGGGFMVAPRASLTDGLLELVIVSKISLAQRIRYLPVLEKGKHLHNPLSFITYQQTEKIHIQSSKKIPAHLDGELLEATEFNISILPKYINIRTA